MKIGWLAPSGELIELHSGEHLWAARGILKKLNCKDEITRPDDFLLSLGYVHISISLFHSKTLRIYWEHHLSPEQVRFLRSYFDQSEIKVEPWDLMRFEQEVNN